MRFIRIRIRWNGGDAIGNRRKGGNGRSDESGMSVEVRVVILILIIRVIFIFLVIRLLDWLDVEIVVECVGGRGKRERIGSVCRRSVEEERRSESTDSRVDSSRIECLSRIDGTSGSEVERI